MRSDFESWMIENYGFEHGQPITNNPPLFVDSDGLFAVEWYNKWLDERRKEYAASCGTIVGSGADRVVDIQRV